MAPISSTKDKQFSFVLSAEEHEMLTKVAAAADASASEWLRAAVREAYERGELETLPQTIRRVAGAFEAAHSEFMTRWKRISAGGGNMAPPAKLLARRVDELSALMDSKAKLKRDLRESIRDYQDKLHRGKNGLDPAKGQSALQEAFQWVWSSVDAWLDSAMADEE